MAGDGLVLRFESLGIVEHSQAAAEAVLNDGLVGAGKDIVALALASDAVPVGAGTLARLCRSRKQQRSQHSGEEKRRQKP